MFYHLVRKSYKQFSDIMANQQNSMGSGQYENVDYFVLFVGNGQTIPLCPLVKAPDEIF